MNIYDYLNWRGDLSFDDSPFNVVDNLLFSYISYTELDGIVPEDKETVTLEYAAEKYFERHTEEEVLNNKSFIAQSPLVLRAMAETERFKDVKLSWYQNLIIEETSEQFAAMHIKFGKGTTYVAFRGTDDTLVGWKEDLQLSYKIVDSQAAAAKYLSDTTGYLRSFYVGGHSKGGNLALYAATKAGLLSRRKIIQVFSNDGPGLDDIAFDEDEFNLIKDKYLKIMPETSVIGKLFDRSENKLIVKSDQFLVMQHDPISWQVLGPDFEEAEGPTNACIMIDEAMKEFLDVLDYPTRELLTNEVFDALDNAGIKNVSEFLDNALRLLPKVLKELTGVDERVKESVGKLIGIFTKLAAEKATGALKGAGEKAEDKIKDMGGAIKGAAGGALRTTADVTSRALNTAAGATERAISTAAGATGRAINTAAGATGRFLGKAKNKAKDMIIRAAEDYSYDAMVLEGMSPEDIAGLEDPDALK